MRGIRNRDKLKKEDLIITLLKSESSAAERNIEEHFNNNDNNTDDDDNTYDDKIRGKINDIRMILSRLGNINDRKMLYKIEKKKNLSDKEKEETYDHLVKIVKALDKKRNMAIS